MLSRFASLRTPAVLQNMLRCTAPSSRRLVVSTTTRSITSSSYRMPVAITSQQRRWFASAEGKKEEPPSDAEAKENNTTSASAKEEASGDATEAAGDKKDALPKESTSKSKEPTIESLQAEAAEWKDKYLHALAEQQNTINRMQVQNENTQKYGNQAFAKQMITTCDTLRLAADSVSAEKLESNELAKSLHDGIVMVESNLLAKLKEFNVVRFKSLGEKFDPKKHDGVFEVDDPTKEPGTVAVVTNEGFTMHDRVIRAAKVGTVRARKEEAKKKE